MLKPVDQVRRAGGPGSTKSPRSRAAGDRTREQLLDAALETVRVRGFGGCSARAIARTANVNPALIFYHFGGVDELLLAALDRTSSVRLARYREALDGVDELGELLAVIQRLFGEEVGTAHIAAVQELIGSNTFSQRCGPRLLQHMDAWVEFAREVIDRVVARSPLRDALDSRDIAFGVVAMYLGMETVWRLQGGRASQIDSLLEAARRYSPMLSRFLGSSPTGDPGPRRPTRVPIS